ncbi:MAG: aminopeptidase P family protein [Micrococcales bacterium]|nr:aminopeptidase P family protein [Micrococcales bacterium]
MNQDENPDKGATRSRTPHSKEFLDYISSGWADKAATNIAADKVAPFAKKRRQAVVKAFSGKVVVIEAGAPKTRSNDTEYRYRPHAAFAHLTGWGSRTVADSVLVIDTKQNKDILFLRPTAGKDSDEFFANSAIGEFWVGARPTLEEIASLLDIETKDLAELDAFLKGADKLDLENQELAQFVSELRLVKDPYEIEQMRIAVAASVSGFEDIVRVLPNSVGIPKGERVIETAFFARARQEGNDLGYDTIAAAGKNACVLHWISNDGEVKPNELVLVDAGVEVDSLYTADITRTLPVSGKFSSAQKEIYLAVLEAADAAFAIAKPGIKFREIHAAAMKVIAQKTADWGILPVSAEESLDENKQFHRRWMVHGTSHHLGIDVHDCAQARKEMYLDAELKEGMVFTIEPGLYFHEDDLLAPKEFRGIGIRIEDDVLVTATGVENLSRALPRDPDAIEAWMAKLS